MPARATTSGPSPARAVAAAATAGQSGGQQQRSAGILTRNVRTKPPTRPQHRVSTTHPDPAAPLAAQQPVPLAAQQPDSRSARDLEAEYQRSVGRSPDRRPNVAIAPAADSAAALPARRNRVSPKQRGARAVSQGGAAFDVGPMAFTEAIAMAVRTAVQQQLSEQGYSDAPGVVKQLHLTGFGVGQFDMLDKAWRQAAMVKNVTSAPNRLMTAFRKAVLKAEQKAPFGARVEDLRMQIARKTPVGSRPGVPQPPPSTGFKRHGGMIFAVETEVSKQHSKLLFEHLQHLVGGAPLDSTRIPLITLCDLTRSTLAYIGGAMLTAGFKFFGANGARATAKHQVIAALQRLQLSAEKSDTVRATGRPNNAAGAPSLTHRPGVGPPPATPTAAAVATPVGAAAAAGPASLATPVPVAGASVVATTGVAPPATPAAARAVPSTPRTAVQPALEDEADGEGEEEQQHEDYDTGGSESEPESDDEDDKNETKSDDDIPALTRQNTMDGSDDESTMNLASIK